MPKTPADTDTISVIDVTRGAVEFLLVGTRPLIYNSKNAKMMQDLLIPKRRMTRADRAGTMKHDPIAEYRRSVSRRLDDDGPTRIVFPSTGFKKSLGTAALDMPGVFKSEIGRLTWVVGDSIDIYGIPQLRMDIVRMKDAARTPDVRTRATLPSWACRVRIEYVAPKLDATAVTKLLFAAGMSCGIGDFRQEKGANNYGSWRLADTDDAEFAKITSTGRRHAQDEALESPTFYDADSEELYNWYQEEVKKTSPTKAAA